MLSSEIWEIAMNVSVGERWEEFVSEAVRTGRYGSASEVVREGLRLVEEREAKLMDLKATIEASIARGGFNTSDEVMAHVEAEFAKAKRPASAAE
jgi:antitoxin ParD1/3/4